MPSFLRSTKRCWLSAISVIGLGQPGLSILAVKFQSNQPGGPIERSMPLCPFPQQARYDGKGDVTQAASWSCPADDQRMLEVGPNGESAGIGAVLRPFRK